jgi:hypothetical protein
MQSNHSKTAGGPEGPWVKAGQGGLPLLNRRLGCASQKSREFARTASVASRERGSARADRHTKRPPLEPFSCVTKRHSALCLPFLAALNVESVALES